MRTDEPSAAPGTSIACIVDVFIGTIFMSPYWPAVLGRVLHDVVSHQGRVGGCCRTSRCAFNSDGIGERF